MRYTLVVLMLFFASCENTWTDEDKDMFRQGCVEDGKSRGMTEAQIKSMCDCRLEIIMKKYPKVADALEHVDSVINDPEIAACK
jgi:hypothetical protein